LKRTSSRCRYIAGDVIKMAIVLDHKANLREVRVIFAHADVENASVMARGTPHPISERGTDGSMRSCVDAEVTLPRGINPGVYKLVRVSYETAGGRLGHLAEDEGLLNNYPRTFEVVRESEEAPKIAHISFVDG
jgi:hypothetical protein